MKKLILSALVLALTGGAAMADRGHGGGRSWGGGHASGGVVVHNNGGFRGEARGGEWRGREWHDHDHDGGWRGHEAYEHRGWNGGWRGEPRYYHNRGYARANIWMPRPMIRTHYYNYGYRPSLLVEDYGYRDGYVFVRGDWQWNGYEWIWQPGHYEPDPAYVEVY